MYFTVSVGGVAGLFLGTSVITLMEILCYFSYRIEEFYKKYKNCKPKVKVNKIKVKPVKEKTPQILFIK